MSPEPDGGVNTRSGPGGDPPCTPVAVPLAPVQSTSPNSALTPYPTRTPSLIPILLGFPILQGQPTLVPASPTHPHQPLHPAENPDWSGPYLPPGHTSCRNP